MARSLSAITSSSTPPKKSAASTTTKSSPDSPAQPPMPSPSSPALNPSLSNIAGNLNRSAVELAKDWRTDKILRNLEALLVVADVNQTFLISGTGDVIDPDEPIAAIGSGGSYAIAAARALMENSQLSAREVAEKSMKIAADICIYTNHNITIEELMGPSTNPSAN